MEAATQNNIYKYLKAFIESFATDYIVMQGQQNRVPPPKKKFVVMQEIGRSRLATNLRNYYAEGDNELQQNITSTEISIQIDIYGPDSADIAQQFEILFRDYIATDFFPKNIAPLYCENFRQIALQDTEKQYNQRWTTTAKFNILPETITKIEFIHNISTYLFPLN